MTRSWWNRRFVGAAVLAAGLIAAVPLWADEPSQSIVIPVGMPAPPAVPFAEASAPAPALQPPPQPLPQPEAPLPAPSSNPSESTETAPPPTPLTEPSPPSAADLPPAPRGCPPAAQVLQGPFLSEGQKPPNIPLGQVQQGDLPLPINLPTALRLADARPLIIAAAQASLQVAVAQWQRARVMFIPSFNVGGAYLGHAGGSAGNAGPEFINGRNQLMIGGGVTALYSITDVTFSPLAMRQTVRAREFEVQAARNDALQNVADAYFNVQQARGRMSGMLDTQEKARRLVREIRGLAKIDVAEVEVDRALTELANIEREVTLRYQDWRISSADLTRELRLNPITVVAPLEPPDLQVTLISPREPVDGLVPIGLTTRPELAQHQALVQETLVRLRMEKLRPLIPSVILAGNPIPVAPFGNLMFGGFWSDYSGHNNPASFRFDPNVQLFWTLENFGFGNAALIREHRAINQRALVELFRVQDRVAAEVVKAHARVQAAVVAVSRSETEIKEAQISYEGNLKGIRETYRFGDRQVPINRPNEAVDALRQLERAYDRYFFAVGEYNRAQFQLYHALGYPAGVLECERNNGDIRPVDTNRPPQMAPVNAPEPCKRCGP
jgi:outer membrane protein TolC